MSSQLKFDWGAGVSGVTGQSINGLVKAVINKCGGDFLPGLGADCQRKGGGEGLVAKRGAGGLEIEAGKDPGVLREERGGVGSGGAAGFEMNEDVFLEKLVKLGR